MALTDTNPSLCKQFELWKLRFPVGNAPPIIYVLIISQTDTLNFHREPYVTALPLYPAAFQGQMMPTQIQLPFLRGGEDTLHQLPFDCLIGTHGIVTINKKNLGEKLAYLNNDLQKQVQEQLRERLGL